MSFFRYPGGKNKLRKTIIKQLAEMKPKKDNLRYCEPFFGGGSIGLEFLDENKDIKNVWINDFDVGIYCLWESVINHHEEFKERVLKFKPSVEEFHKLKKELTGH